MSLSSPRKRQRIDPLEKAIETALAPGRFIYYKASWPFVEGLQKVAGNLDKVVESEPERAAGLYETFVAACHEKADEIDDSSGEFGMLVQDLFSGWIKSRQTAGAAADETAKLLLTWMEDDPYGFCHDLDREAVKVLDKDGLEALGRQVRARFDKAAGSANGSDDRQANFERRHWGGVLKTLLAARRNVDAYIALCEETELGAKDCKVVAEIYRSRRHPNKALDWVERGLDIARSDTSSSFADHELRDMKRALLVKLGRSEDALESAWIEFQEHPSTYGYKELMRYVPPEGRKAWHAKAMDASEKGELSSQIDLWMEKKETGRLVARIGKATNEELEGLSRYTTEPLARRLARPHPETAARVYRAFGMRIVDARKSKYYASALGHLEHAKKCYERDGLGGQEAVKQSAEYTQLAELVAEAKEAVGQTKGRNQRAVQRQKAKAMERQLDELAKPKVALVDQWIIDGIRLWIETFMPSRITFRVYPFVNSPSFQVLCNLKRDCFVDSDLEDLLYGYGNRPNVPLEVFGLVASLPSESDTGFDPMAEFDTDTTLSEQVEFEKAFRQVFGGMDGLESFVRYSRYPNVTVHPIAVYRSFAVVNTAEAG